MGVFWITGLSSSGKTTISNLLYEKLSINKNLIQIDGDIIREVFGSDLGYSYEERLISAYRNARLCKFLNEKGLLVICSTISMYDEVREWNRSNIKNYFEVYLKVSKNELKSRDSKGIYKGSQSNVVNFENGWEEPKNPHLVIKNEKIEDLNKNIEKIISNCFFL